VQSATQRLLDRRARLSDEELESCREQGLSDTELLDIVAVIGWYVMSTYTNNLAVTAIDDFFKG
jgi:alkylhydroperoxidase family enzyme